MKRIYPNDIKKLIVELGKSHDIVAPIVRPDGSRIFGSLDDGQLSLTGGYPAGKPFLPLFPPTDPVLVMDEGEWSLPPRPRQPLLLVGLLPADRRALAFIDRFFRKGYGDPRYGVRRESALIIGIAGSVAENERWVEPSGTGCDLELIRDQEGWLAAPVTARGEGLVRGYRDGEAVVPSSPPETDPIHLVEEASRLLREREPDDLWEEIAGRCIGCGGCTQVCPTCTCYGVSDLITGARGERNRLWDSCQFAGFMREAGGHNPLGKAAERSRRRIHHKLVDDPERWGEMGCVGCGRCDRHCPTGIGMIAVCRRIVTGRWGE